MSTIEAQPQKQRTVPSGLRGSARMATPSLQSHSPSAFAIDAPASTGDPWRTCSIQHALPSGIAQATNCPLALCAGVAVTQVQELLSTPTGPMALHERQVWSKAAHQMKSMVRCDTPSGRNFHVVKGTGLEPLLDWAAIQSHMQDRPS